MDKICYIKHALNSLERCPTELQDNSFKEIIHLLKEIIIKDCSHDWIEDWIDLPCGNMKKIYYCTTCETTRNA